jgi:hypothetical protein
MWCGHSEESLSHEEGRGPSHHTKGHLNVARGQLQDHTYLQGMRPQTLVQGHSGPPLQLAPCWE